MCEPMSMADIANGIGLGGLVVEQPRRVAIIRDRVPYPDLPLSVPLQERLNEIDRVYVENVARINRERDENIAAIDRKYALVDRALAMGGPDTTYWLWVCGLGAATVIIQLLRSLL